MIEDLQKYYIITDTYKSEIYLNLVMSTKDIL